ncbi:MAG TPA: potassium-transporting ATPase subunit KdpA, partial [Gemmataceae bacterium]|nr:potassium-transporting ATPase subunit KdpA [Gemmataceae bacterium]
MTANAWLQIAMYFGVLLALVRPLGWYMARVFQNQPCGLDGALGWLERLIYRLGGIDPSKEMNWKIYAVAMLLFKAVSFLFLYVLLRVQHLLPGGPDSQYLTTPMTADLAFNTAVSFVTNTNWQSYGGETTMPYLSQMIGLTVQNFVSAAGGMAVLVALIRGIARRQANTIGNFWVDLTRTTLYILLPLSLVLAVILVSQGVIQNFRPYATVTLAQPQEIEEPKKDADGKPV